MFTCQTMCAPASCLTHLCLVIKRLSVRPIHICNPRKKDNSSRQSLNKSKISNLTQISDHSLTQFGMHVQVCNSPLTHLTALSVLIFCLYILCAFCFLGAPTLAQIWRITTFQFPSALAYFAYNFGASATDIPWSFINCSFATSSLFSIGISFNGFQKPNGALPNSRSFLLSPLHVFLETIGALTHHHVALTFYRS